MSKISDRLILSVLLPLIIGCAAILPVIYSENGYVAGFIFLPLFLLVAVASLILFVIALIGLIAGSKSAAWILLSAVLLPASFISLALIAKYFEIGAYYQEPMTPILGGVNSVVVFKEGTTNEQINNFWKKTMSIERADGRGYDHLPSVRSMGQGKLQNGQETIIFDFFPSATEEQKQFVFSRVKSSPIVYQLLENEPPKEQKASPSPTVKSGEFKEAKTVNSTDSK